MKKLLYVISLLLMLGMTGCSNEDGQNEQKWNSCDSIILLFGNKIPYRRQEIESLPDWMKTKIQTDLGCYVLKGTKNGAVIYNIYNTFSASSYGYYYDKDGNWSENSMGMSEIAENANFNLVHDWECIYYCDKTSLPVMDNKEPELPGDKQSIEPLGNRIGYLQNVEGSTFYDFNHKLWYIRKIIKEKNHETFLEFYPLHYDIKFQRATNTVVFSGEVFEMNPPTNSADTKCYAIKLTAINYNDTTHKMVEPTGDTVSVYGVKVPYLHLNPDSLPVWMRPYFDSLLMTFILKGTKDGNLVYNIYTAASSSRYGWFFDKDNNYINVKNGEEYFNLIHDWECIYYRRLEGLYFIDH